MDFDDDEFQGQNRQLAGEGSSKVSPVLHSYTLPKFDFDDTLNGHLNFNSLVGSEVFLGQEDNQWIEEYSRGSSGLEFNSSVVESRHNNVWSEATSLESVNLLLKSVGQEEKVVVKSVTEQLNPDRCDEIVILTKDMDPNLNQDSQISGGELDSVVLNEKHNLSVLEKKVDNTFDDVILTEPNQDRVGPSENPVTENPSAENCILFSENLTTETNIPLSGNPPTETSILISENPSTEISIPYNVNLSAETSIPFSENLSTETNIPFSVNPPTETNVPIIEIPSTETSILISENPSTETSIPSSEQLPAENSIPFSESASQPLRSKDPDSPKSNAGSLTNISPIKISSIEENKTVMEKDAQQIISDTSMVSGSVQVDCKTTSSAIHLDKDDSLTEKQDVEPSLLLESNDMDIEVVEVVDSQKNVEPSLIMEGSEEKTVTAYNVETDVSVRVEQVSGQRSSPDTGTTENDEQPKSPILGVSLVHQGSKENTEVRSPSEGHSQIEFSQVESVVASVSKNPSTVVEKEASDLAVKAVHEIDARCVTPGKSYNSSLIEQEPRGKNGSQDCFKKLDTTPFESPEKPGDISQTECLQDPKESMTEANKSNEHSPSNTTDNVENKSQSVSLGNATQEETNITFEVNKRADLGKDDKGSLSSPSVQVSNLPKITDEPSKDSNSNHTDLKKSHEVSVTPQNPSGLTSQTGVKGKSERKPRRKSVGKDNTKKGTTSARDLVRGEITPVLLTPPATGQVTRFEEVKSRENVTKPGVILSSPKIPDLNNSSSVYRQPFTDNQQVQLRAQILVYGSLIAGSPPEETHMIAAFGQSDGGRLWDGVWRACLERIHGQKSQLKSSTPIQSRSDMRDAGNISDQAIKHASIQNKIPASPIGGPNNKGTPTPPFVSPMIPFSSPLWNPTTASDNLPSSGMTKTAHFDYHQILSPLRPTYQTPPPTVLNYNPSWLSQGPFSGQWLTSSPIPTFNPAPRFPSLPLTESVKLTPVKESDGSVVKLASNPTVLNSAPVIFLDGSSGSGMKRSTVDQTPIDSKSRKKKKNNNNIPVVSIPCSTPVAVSIPAFMTSKTIHHTKGGDQNVGKVVISEESLTKVEESKVQAKEAADHANYAKFMCNGVWSQMQKQYKYNYDLHLNSNDEAKLVSSAVSIAAAASVAKAAATAAKIASDVAEQARLMVNRLNKSQNLDKSKHAENLDAIVKAAELAAEAVSQAGKIVAMSEPFSLKDLVEAGPEGYWKTPRLLSNQQSLTAKDLNVIERRNDETAPDKGILATTSGGNLMENQTMEVDGTTVPFTIHEKSKRKPRVRKGHEVVKTFGAVTESEIGSIDASIVGQPEPNISSENLTESDIKEGSLVEVFKDDDKHNAAWFGANVLSLKDGKALVSYTEMQSDEGSGKFNEWLPLKVEGSEVPKIRLAHPVTAMQGTRKRRRTAATDFMWSNGDRVDVWRQNHWREGVVMETNKIDSSLLTVQFPAKGETSVVRSWFVRPTLIWKDDKWVMCPASEKHLSSPGNMPQEKRLKLGSPFVESKMKTGPSDNIDHSDPTKQEESRPLSLSTHERVFNVGNTRENKITSQRTMRSGSHKEGPGVIFGVPKPGKKQKFMDVSKHYVTSGSNTTTHDSIKFTKYLIPNPPGSRGWKNSSRNDPKEKQVVETKPPMVKSRKPPIPSVRTVSTKSTMNKSSLDSGSDGENQSGQQIQMDCGSSSDTENKSERLNKRKFAPTAAVKVEKSLPEVVGARRSIRKIQPTSRLLEGLQSSMTISKMPALSHSTQRSHNKVTPKGTIAEEKEASNKNN